MKITNEVKTGIVVVAAIGVAAFFWVKTASLTSKPYRVKVYFNSADGIKQDSIVKLSGIEVGRVEKIKFSYAPETKIELILTVDRAAKIHEDSIAFIATSGMIGDAFVGITPGSAEKPFIGNGATLVSEDPVEMRKLMKRAEAIAENLDNILIEVKKLVKDNAGRIDNIAANIEQTTANFKDFSEDIKQHPWKLLMKGK
jgi:phospholipid/cholesterol/gamma-HCH transport system substrate-binding protein